MIGDIAKKINDEMTMMQRMKIKRSTTFRLCIAIIIYICIIIVALGE